MIPPNTTDSPARRVARCITFHVLIKRYSQKPTRQNQERSGPDLGHTSIGYKAERNCIAKYSGGLQLVPFTWRDTDFDQRAILCIQAELDVERSIYEREAPNFLLIGLHHLAMYFSDLANVENLIKIEACPSSLL
jgi:hypothetical protein